jgi:hypothetical protein
VASNWWANKVGAQQPPVAPQQAQPAARPYQPPTQPQNYPPVQQQVPMGERCPGCGSGNYGGATPESRKRCYDCGYPIQQSGTGVGKGVVGGQPGGGPATPARQIASGGYNPQTIIGHI